MPIGNKQASFSTNGIPPPSHEAGAQEDHVHEGEQDDGLSKVVVTVAVVAVGAAVFGAALLPGIALGVAAVAAPKYLPRFAGALSPLFKSTVRGTYKLAQQSKEMFAEAQEQVQDIVAEVKTEGKAAKAKEPTAKEWHAA